MHPISEQIFDSSIAADWQVRHVFMDLLVLADADGNVDMTVDALVRRTNVPRENVERALAALLAPDPDSRTKEADGRRLEPVSPERDWGWRIVNFARYRAAAAAEAGKSGKEAGGADGGKKGSRAEYMRRYMSSLRKVTRAENELGLDLDVENAGNAVEEADQEVIDTAEFASMMTDKQRGSKAFRKVWREWLTFRRVEKRKPVRPMGAGRQLAMLSKYNDAEVAKIIEESIRNGWEGIFPLKGMGGREVPQRDASGWKTGTGARVRKVGASKEDK